MVGVNIGIKGMSTRVENSSGNSAKRLIDGEMTMLRSALLPLRRLFFILGARSGQLVYHLAARNCKAAP